MGEFPPICCLGQDYTNSCSDGCLRHKGSKLFLKNESLHSIESACQINTSSGLMPFLKRNKFRTGWLRIGNRACLHRYVISSYLQFALKCLASLHNLLKSEFGIFGCCNESLQEDGLLACNEFVCSKVCICTLRTTILLAVSPMHCFTPRSDYLCTSMALGSS